MNSVRARRILSAVFLVASVPFLLVELFPARLDGLMNIGSYLVFHNSAEFFSIMVSLSVFGVGWYAYDQSRDRHALFLGTAFLAVGLIDFMHALANAAMPAFITANSTNKSTQYWISARLLDSSALLVSAFVYPDQPRSWLTKRKLLFAALAVPALVFTGVTFFPSRLPATFVPGLGLTPVKVFSEYLVIFFLLLALRAYWKRMERTGDGLLVYYMAAFIVGIFSEAAFASYKTGFDTYNVLGHVYKVAAFFLIYKGAFAASVSKPYLQLFDSNDRLRTEIGERKQVEEKVRALNAELEQRVSERTSQLDDAGRRKDEFLGMLSHELRNPLAPIRNSVYILEQADPATEQASRARTVIKRQTEHLTRLVDDLLDVTRIARGKIELRRSRVDLREVVQRAAEDFRPMMEERGIALRTVLAESRVWSEADATRITQVLGNLLHNAAKFTSAGNEVTLSLRAAGADAQIRVRDTGAGIDPALLPNVFDAFVQGRRTLARAEGGLGLGLALVKGITELHGGSVSAESGGTGKGAEFVVRLPLVAAGVMEDRQPAVVQRMNGARRVLVVDDNADAADSLADVVKILGHSVDVAYDGPSAVERARANPPDIVLCDVGLPGMSGYEVARALRASANTPRLFAVSGYAQPDDVKKAFEAGFDGHVAKPCDPAEIERLLA
ncbi:MAG TPA: MASE3 domain-containing protein [Anaeromyxobacter sp.]